MLLITRKKVDYIYESMCSNDAEEGESEKDEENVKKEASCA